MFDTTLSGSNRTNGTLGQVIDSYYQLTKPRIIVLLLITTAGGMWVAAGGNGVDPLLMLVTLVGGGVGFCIG